MYTILSIKFVTFKNVESTREECEFKKGHNFGKM